MPAINHGDVDAEAGRSPAPSRELRVDEERRAGKSKLQGKRDAHRTAAKGTRSSSGSGVITIRTISSARRSEPGSTGRASDPAPGARRYRRIHL
jgi:hypothetical protein